MGCYCSYLLSKQALTSHTEKLIKYSERGDAQCCKKNSLTQHIEDCGRLGLAGPVGEDSLVLGLVLHGDAVDDEAVVAALLLDLEVRLALLDGLRVRGLAVHGPRDRGLYKGMIYRVVQLNLTQEIGVFCILFHRALNFLYKIQLDHSVQLTPHCHFFPLQYMAVHLVSEQSFLMSNHKFRHGMNFLYQSPTLISGSTKDCPRPDGPPCIRHVTSIC